MFGACPVRKRVLTQLRSRRPSFWSALFPFPSLLLLFLTPCFWQVEKPLVGERGGKVAPAQILGAVELVPGVPSREVGRGGALWSVVSVSCICLPCQDGRTRNRWCIPKIKPIGKLYVREPPPELSQACLGNRLLLLVLLSLAYLVLLFLLPHCLTGAPLPAAPSSPQETATSTASCCFSSVAAPCLLLAATRRCPVLSLDRVSLLMFWRQPCSA